MTRARKGAGLERELPTAHRMTHHSGAQASPVTTIAYPRTRRHGVFRGREQPSVSVVTLTAGRSVVRGRDRCDGLFSSPFRTQCQGTGCLRGSSCSVRVAQAEGREQQTPDPPGPGLTSGVKAPADPVSAEVPAPAHNRHLLLRPRSVGGTRALWGLPARTLYPIVGLRPVNLSPPL